MNERILKLAQRLKNGKTVMVIGLIGIGLIFLSSVLPAKSSTESEEKSISAEKYQKELETQMTAVVKKISGCDAKVVITLDTGVTYNYAEESKSADEQKKGDTVYEESKNSEGKKTVITNENGAQTPIVINEFLPQIRGVAVVYYARNDENINEKIASALKAALAVTSKQIFIYGNGGK